MIAVCYYEPAEQNTVLRLNSLTTMFVVTFSYRYNIPAETIEQLSKMNPRTPVLFMEEIWGEDNDPEPVSFAPKVTEAGWALAELRNEQHRRDERRHKYLELDDENIPF